MFDLYSHGRIAKQRVAEAQQERAAFGRLREAGLVPERPIRAPVARVLVALARWLDPALRLPERGERRVTRAQTT